RSALLCGLTSYWFKQLPTTIAHHFLDQPSERFLQVKKTKPLNLEIIVRGFLAGSMIKHVQEGFLAPYAHDPIVEILPTLSPYEQLPSTCVHLTTKAQGNQHDEPLPLEAAFNNHLLTDTDWFEIRRIAAAVYQLGFHHYLAHGYILADTKLEFGLGVNAPHQLMIIDEILTPDASRIWLANTDQENQLQPSPLFTDDIPISSDKDIARRYLKTHHPGDSAAMIPQMIAHELVTSYLNVYEQITGTTFLVQLDNNHQNDYPAALAHDDAQYFNHLTTG
ncbi:MAG: hypothetical protein OXC40_00960, partial [Proteobacteria bacterium]|nr:hypothetical protein [Pseudomonadota bacterium]